MSPYEVISVLRARGLPIEGPDASNLIKCYDTSQGPLPLYSCVVNLKYYMAIHLEDIPLSLSKEKHPAHRWILEARLEGLLP